MTGQVHFPLLAWMEREWRKMLWELKRGQDPVLELEENGDRVTWSYDKTYQLTRERRSGVSAYDTTFVYDTTGNRILRQSGSARTTSVYDAANQLRYSQDSTGRTTYAFDAAGNQQIVREPSASRTTYGWDHGQRISRSLK